MLEMLSATKVTMVAEALLSPAFLLYPPLLFLVGNTIVFILNTLRPKAYPPGPKVFPGVGNILQLDRTFPFLTFSVWAKKYGNDTPLGIKKGTTNIVVLNSGHVVRELVERRGAVYADRPWNFINEHWILKQDIRTAIFQNNSTWLTRWRKEFNANFGPTAIQKLRPAYEAESARLLVKLLECPPTKKADLESILVCWIMSVPCLAVCGRRPDYMDDHGFEVDQFRHANDEYVAVVSPHTGDLLPFLRYFPELFGMNKQKQRARENREGILKAGSHLLSAAKEQRSVLDAGRSIPLESMLAKMLKQQNEKNDRMFTATDLGNTAFHILSAATATSTAVFSIMLMILAKFPEVQQRARNEVLEVLGGAAPKATDISRLKYVDAFWNETHRWRPAAPQAIPKATTQDDVYNGYLIPKGATILINVWHIHHSEEDYEDPEEFNPERFLKHPFGMRLDEAHNPAQMDGSSWRVIYDFGAGRRVCPGSHSAKQNLVLGLAQVLWAFDVLPPEDKEIDLSLETGFIQKAALHPRDCDVRFKLRDGRTKEDILANYAQAYEAEAQMMGWENGAFR